MARTFSKDTGIYAGFGVNAVNSLVSGAGALTIAVWAKYGSISLNNNDNRVFNEYTGSGNSGLLLGTSTTPQFRVGIRSQSSDSLQAVNGATTLSTGVWYHLCATVNFASPAIVAYLNGASDGTLTPTFGSSTYNPSNVTSHFLLGAFSGSGSTPVDTGTQFGGDMAEIGVWTVALTASEVAALARGVPPSRVRTSSLVFYVPLNNESTTLNNRVKSGPNGTTTGSIPYAAHAPVAPWFGESIDWALATSAAPATYSGISRSRIVNAGGFGSKIRSAYANVGD